jgi:hypothetical protein
MDCQRSLGIEVERDLLIEDMRIEVERDLLIEDTNVWIS